MRKRSLLRGISYAIFFHYLVLFGLLLLLFLLRPFMWAAIYGVPYQRVPGAMDPQSGEWLISQAIGFLSWIAGSYAACRWDKENSNRAVLIVSAICLVLVAAGGIVEGMDLLRQALYYLEIPIAIATGWLLHRRRERKGKML